MRIVAIGGGEIGWFGANAYKVYRFKGKVVEDILPSVGQYRPLEELVLRNAR
jgi:hypothetical protein